MKVAVVGAASIGAGVAAALSRDGVPVVMLDDEDVIFFTPENRPVIVGSEPDEPPRPKHEPNTRQARRKAWRQAGKTHGSRSR